MVPRHFDPSRVGEVFRVPYGERAREAKAWREAHGIIPASHDAHRVGLLLIDVQNTFCLPGFELFVAGRSGRGAVEDNERLCRFIYENLGQITRIHATLDTHEAVQIFHAVSLVDANGEHPEPMTAISLEDVESGRWRVNPRVTEAIPGLDQEHLLHYARSLSRKGKYALMVWPYHAMLGGIGHALVSSVEEALFFHNIARASPTSFEIKGQNPLTENYSALSPEVCTGPDGKPIASRNDALVDALLGYDTLIVAGQAKSHCVQWTVSDLLDEIRRRDPALAQKIYLLDDCSSPVVVPGVCDFTDDAEAAYREFEAAGMHRVGSTEPIESWPGIEATLAREER